MAKPVLENEKMKRAYLKFMRQAEGKDEKTLDRALSAICEFEASTDHKPFKAFHIDQAVRFKEYLATRKSTRSGKPLSKATVDMTLYMTKGFFRWLAGQRGYMARIKYTDAEYFNNTLKNARAVQSTLLRQVPSLDQVKYAFGKMPSETSLQLRDRAIIALFTLTGARIQAVASLRLKHLVLDDARLFQDAREVQTKAGKTIDTTFFPVGQEFIDALEAYVGHLKSDLVFGPDDPLFPKQKLLRTDNGFTPSGLSREFYSRPNGLNEVVKAAFEAAQLPAFTPHSFRHMLADLGSSMELTPKAFKAWSMNLGHENVATTVSAYLQISPMEQRALMRRINE